MADPGRGGGGWRWSPSFTIRWPRHVVGVGRVRARSFTPIKVWVGVVGGKWQPTAYDSLAQCEGSVWGPQRKPGRVLASDDVDAVVHWQVFQCVFRIRLRFASLCSRLAHATPSLAFAKYQHDLDYFRSCGCRGPLAGASMRSARLAPLRPPLPSPHSRNPFACICKIST